MSFSEQLNQAAANGDVEQFNQLIIKSTDVRKALLQSFGSDNAYAQQVEYSFAKLIDKCFLITNFPNIVLSEIEVSTWMRCVKNLDELNVITFLRLKEDELHALRLIHLFLAFSKANFKDLSSLFLFVLPKFKDEEIVFFIKKWFISFKDAAFAPYNKQRYQEFVGYLFSLKPWLKEALREQLVNNKTDPILQQQYQAILDNIFRHERYYLLLKPVSCSFRITFKFFIPLMRQANLKDRQRMVLLASLYEAFAINDKIQAQTQNIINIFTVKNRASFFQLPQLQQAFVNALFKNPEDKETALTILGQVNLHKK